MLFLTALLACGTSPAPTPKPQSEAAPAPAPEGVKHAGLFKTLPAHMHKGEVPSKQVIDLGRMLYYENRLSKNHDISCNSCHPLGGFGADNEPTSPGHKGVRGGRNSPTSYNAALHITQFWDGRAPDVEAQAKGPILNPVEMAMPDEASVIAVLNSIPGYVTAFKEAFPGTDDAVTYDNLAIAIGAFERGLVTPDPFDAYLGGKEDALTSAQKSGLDSFVSVGCTTCHMGAGLGGAMYQKMGLVNPYESKDLGRYEVTKNDADKMMFKVPSLRNITQTGPYFHDGSVKKLDEAVKLMAHHQLGKDLTDNEVRAIVEFLGALEGEIPKPYIAKPKLPESGRKTPKADPS